MSGYSTHYSTNWFRCIGWTMIVIPSSDRFVTMMAMLTGIAQVVCQLSVGGSLIELVLHLNTSHIADVSILEADRSRT